MEYHLLLKCILLFKSMQLKLREILGNSSHKSDDLHTGENMNIIFF